MVKVMEGAMATATATAAMVGATATAMEGVTAMEGAAATWAMVGAMALAMGCATAIAVAAVDDKDGVQWQRWGGGVQWRQQRLTATAMEYR